MDNPKESGEQQAEPSDPAIEASATFLAALFAESDTILLRPIETWNEARKRRSRVDYRNTCYGKLGPALLKVTLPQLLMLSAREKVNLFFGVCPRVGNKGRFDFAWQIRTVRVLWTDIDRVTAEEAQERIRRTGLPLPSITVNSGNGVHLYWILNAPYLIDDAGDPLPVETEWTESLDGRKKPRKYIVENGDRVYLDQRRHVSRLSPKAEHLQDVLTGIAKLLGSDRTTDLSKLLRLPGTFNRMDQRNGREPVPTALIECEPTRRHPLATFKTFISESPETQQAKQIAAMPLPQPRRISNAEADKLAELIAACAIAPAGSRSEADFAVCCYAIGSGIGREEVWTQIEQVGKFAEQGRSYFDRTWDNAEYDVRAATFDKLQKRAATRVPQTPNRIKNAIGDGISEPPDDVHMDDGSGRPVIQVNSQTMPVGDILHQVTDRLVATGNCFSRADQLVVVHDQQLASILASAELAGLLNEHVEFYFVDEQSGEFKPLTPAYGNTWLHNRVERARLPAIKLFTHNPVYTDDWRLVGPGYDAQSGIYYAGPVVPSREGTEYLDAILKDFCFKTPADRTNYVGMLLTGILVPHCIGSKPAALFNGNQPSLGKSILAQIIAIVRDGKSAETATYNRNDEEFEKRLGAIVRSGATTIIIDNAKAQGRNARIESPCLERSITDPILSYRLLGQSASIRAENSHIFCITANTPDVSRDLITRSVVINLHYEGNPEKREFSIDDVEGFAQRHRIEVLGELIGMVELCNASGMPRAKVHSRFNKRGWGNIVGGILNACGEPDFLANAEEAAAQLDETRREFAELIGVLVEHPQGTWTASELVELCRRHGLLAADLGDGSARSLATKMGTLAGRFVGERFPLADGREAVFHRSADRNGNVYRVAIHE